MKHNLFGTTADYVRAFTTVMADGITDEHRTLLQKHYAAQNHTVTWAELAKAMGYSDRRVVHTQYGRFAERIANQLGVSRANCNYWLDVLASNQTRHPITNHTAFTLRQPVVNALRQLGLVAVRAKHAWTCYWQFRYWKPGINDQGMAVWLSGSNLFHKRRVEKGDTVYIVSVGEGQLYLGGRMRVKEIVPRSRAVQLKNKSLFHADEWVVGSKAAGTPLDLYRRLDIPLTQQLRFETSEGPQALQFESEGRLDRQTIRGVRRLTPESAILFDRVIAATDGQPPTSQMRSVTAADLTANPRPIHPTKRELDIRTYWEGEVTQRTVNQHERNPAARVACVAEHGVACAICGFCFGDRYGETMKGYIHVHHLYPLSAVNGRRAVKPGQDLVPVCPNCHAVIHQGGGCRDMDEVKDMWRNHNPS